MQCPSCNAELEAEDVAKRVCSRCKERFVVGAWRMKLVVASLAFVGLAAYTFMTRGTESLMAVGLLLLFALLLILRARR
jgi:hypothetical protein